MIHSCCQTFSLSRDIYFFVLCYTKPDNFVAEIQYLLTDIQNEVFSNILGRVVLNSKVTVKYSPSQTSCRFYTILLCPAGTLNSMPCLSLKFLQSV